MVAANDEGWDEAPRGIGWLAFAAALLGLAGIFKIFDALWAWKYDDEISEEVQTIVFERDPAAWGWLWLIVGILLVVAALAVVSGAEWARWVGIVAAGIGAITFFPWIYFRPGMAILSIALCVMVIYALAVYGGGRLTSGGRPRA